MQNIAWLFHGRETGASVLSLKNACAQEGLEVEDKGPAPDPEALSQALPRVPGIVFLPAIEEDCAGVKLVQNALAQSPPQHLAGPPRVIVLYGATLPSARFLSLAFREGADDAIALDDNDEAPGMHVRRAIRVLSGRLESQRHGGELGQRGESMRAQIERMERDHARCEERLLALASAARRLATGELRLNDTPPVLLIVSSSKSQATSAAQVAEPMGFEVHTAGKGEEGLEQIVACRPAVILTDGTLPDMDGTAFAQSARQVLGRRAVIIVAWSSNPEAEDSLLAPNSGIDDFVLKSPGRETVERLAAALLGALR